ncbi:Zinc finger BED domain-containing protein RICESLEEPER 2 [Linum perenne]
MSEFECGCQHGEDGLDDGGISEEVDWDPQSQMCEYDDWELDNREGIIRQGLAKMVVMDKLPFKLIEHEGYKHIMSIACPKFKIPSEETLMSECYQLFLDEKEKMKQYLKDTCSGRVSLTVDRWTTGLRGINYLCVTAHFVDDGWELNKRILSFCPISSTATGVDIGNVIESCLLDWGIDKVFAITMDNGSSNDVAIDYLRDRFNQWGTGILGGKYLHIRCVSQIINSVAFDLLKEMCKSVNRVREAIRYIRVSDSRLYKFKQCVAGQGIQCSISTLPFDEPTNWRSTYLMLESACKFEKAFNQFASMDPRYEVDPVLSGSGRIRRPDETDWGNVTRLVKFLEQLHKLTLKVSGSLYTRSNRYLADFYSVPWLLNHWVNGDDLQLSEMAERMKEKYQAYWGKVEKNHKLLYIAAILNPKCNLGFIEYAFSEMYEGEMREELGRQVKKDVYQLFEYYDTTFRERETKHIETAYDGDTYMAEYDNDELMRGYLEYLREENAKLGTELDRYFDKGYVLKGDETDILKWWELWSNTFPILARMAKDILAVPVTTAAPEAAFCSHGRVLNPFLSSLRPEIAEAVICSGDWLRSTTDQLVAVGDSLV